MIPTHSHQSALIDDITEVSDVTTPAPGGMWLGRNTHPHIDLIIHPHHTNMLCLEVLTPAKPKKPHEVESWRLKGKKRFGR